MIKSRAMTILAGNDAVQVLGANVHLIAVAFRTIFVHLLFACVTVFEWLILPDFLIGLVVIAVHKTVLTRAEIVRDVKRPEKQECGNNANDHEQWPPNMTFHDNFPLFQ